MLMFFFKLTGNIFRAQKFFDSRLCESIFKFERLTSQECSKLRKYFPQLKFHAIRFESVFPYSNTESQFRLSKLKFQNKEVFLIS